MSSELHYEDQTHILLKQDVHQLNPPSLVHKTLRLLNIHTIGDLLDFDLSEAKHYRGVGSAKVQALASLQEEARHIQELEPQDEAFLALTSPSFIEELTATQADLDGHWAQTLRRIDLRTHNLLEQAEVYSLRELVSRFEAGTLLSIPGLGQAALEHIQDHLNDLIYFGVDGYLWRGLDEVPSHLDESVSYVLQSLDSDDHLLVVTRFLQHQTLEEIGTTLNISRERVRQKLERIFDLIRRQWHDHFDDLLGELIAVLDDRGGLISSTVCHALTEHANHDYVVLGLEILGINSRWCPTSHFLTTLNNNQIESLFQQFRTDLAARTQGVTTAAQLEQMARNRGWPAPAPEIIAFLENRWEVSLGDDMLVQHPWVDWEVLCAQSLASHDKPVSLEQLIDLLVEDYGLTSRPSTRQIYLVISQAPDIHASERGLYIHRNKIPLSDEKLNKIQEDTISIVEHLDHAISTSKLLEHLEPHHPGVSAAISPMLLRDILGRHPKIKLFQSTDMIAHLDAFQGKRQTQAELLNDLLSDQMEPLDCNAICELIPEHISFHPAAIYQTLQQSPFILNLGQGSFLHREAIGLTQRALEAVCESALQILSQRTHPISASRLLDALAMSPNTAYLKVHPVGSKVLMAILDIKPTISTGPGDLIMCSKDSEEPTRDPALLMIQTLVQEHGELSSPEVKTHIKDLCGWDSSSSVFYHTLHKAVDLGLVSKSGSQDSILLTAILPPEN